MHNSQELYACRTCGKMQDEPIWGEDGQSPSFNICGCCGVEFGYEDCNLDAIQTYRKKWLAEGGKWLDSKVQPRNWSLEQQMKNIPQQYL